uniref:RING-type domain-containing protein n=1 Tax=Corethron hystrix TaxID=216773 RepID=A0A7S1FU94_9STRA|mmetsp:Transcript_28280/g.64690  ORF Transcript_28280/g.64690 Transcript_28280/m.64690 type:complete len:298 (+) Transcript_28280:298-1191(+)
MKVCALCDRELKYNIGASIECGHCFHRDCFAEWKGDTKVLPECPICQKTIINFIPFYLPMENTDKDVKEADIKSRLIEQTIRNKRNDLKRIIEKQKLDIEITRTKVKKLEEELVKCENKSKVAQQDDTGELFKKNEEEIEKLKKRISTMKKIKKQTLLDNKTLFDIEKSLLRRLYKIQDNMDEKGKKALAKQKDLTKQKDHPLDNTKTSPPRDRCDSESSNASFDSDVSDYDNEYTFATEDSLKNAFGIVEWIPSVDPVTTRMRKTHFKMVFQNVMPDLGRCIPDSGHFFTNLNCCR